jgi:uncharacterized membrane protein
MTFLYAFISVLVVYLIIEGLWLGVIAKKTYQQALGERLRDSYKIWPWVVFYLAYSGANVHLTVMPNMLASSFMPTLIDSFIFGAAGYGAYNLTCYSILKDWPLGITLKDWAWGTFSTTLSAVVGWWVIAM